MGGEQGPGLGFETGNLTHDESGKQTRLEGKLLPCPACRGLKEQEGTAQVQQVNVQPSAPPENLLGPTQAPSAFPVFVQHMPANNGGQPYNELTWRQIQMSSLKPFIEAIVMINLTFFLCQRNAK